MRRLSTIFILTFCIAIAGCATKVPQETAPPLQPAEQPKQLRIGQGLDVVLSTGYTTHIKPQTAWSLVGTIPQGEVYKSRDQVLTVEGEHVSEANLVLKGDELVGFYLPVEHTFVRLSPTQPLLIYPRE